MPLYHFKHYVGTKINKFTMCCNGNKSNQSGVGDDKQEK